MFSTALAGPEGEQGQGCSPGRPGFIVLHNTIHFFTGAAWVPVLGPNVVQIHMWQYMPVHVPGQ